MPRASRVRRTGTTGARSRTSSPSSRTPSQSVRSRSQTTTLMVFTVFSGGVSAFMARSLRRQGARWMRAGASAPSRGGRGQQLQPGFGRGAQLRLRGEQRIVVEADPARRLVLPVAVERHRTLAGAVDPEGAVEVGQVDDHALRGAED